MHRLQFVIAFLAFGFFVQSASAQKRLIYVIVQDADPLLRDIISSNLDGTDPQPLHTGLTGAINVLVDNDAQKLYYRSGIDLRRSDLDGTNDEFLGSPATCIASVVDTSLSDDGTRIHTPVSTCDTTGAFLFNTPFNGSITGLLESTETVPGSGSVYMLSELCELAVMDQNGTTLTEVGEPFPGDICFPSPLAYDNVTDKFYAVVSGMTGPNISRFDSDGTNPETLFPVLGVGNMVVDGDGQKVYFMGGGVNTDPDFGIVQANFDGTGETVVVSGQVQAFDIASSLLPDCSGLSDCSGNGTCVADGVCECNNGWSGADCSTFDCDEVNNCSGNGTCVGANLCNCDEGFGGQDCTAAIPAASTWGLIAFSLGILVMATLMIFNRQAAPGSDLRA